ncbi:MAG: hypothetical protein GY797_38720 [Deltaproteobacteria bacterium]|nr:hypothetical protein [Deltaproteobacteria bacterium]
MDQFTKISILTLRKAILEALKGVSEEHGINITMGGFRYSPTECSTKITCISAKDGDGRILHPYEKAYQDRQRVTTGMRDIGDMFSLNGTDYTIAGWKPRNRKYPLMVKNEIGILYKLPGRHAFK